MIIEGKLAPEYDYHGVSSPWIQVKLLRMLGLLGADDQRWLPCNINVYGQSPSTVDFKVVVITNSKLIRNATKL